VKRRHGRRADAGWAALFLAPSLAVFAVFVIYPLGRTFLMSTRRVGLFGRGSESVGLQQLADVATSASFRNSMWRSLQLVALTVPTGIALGVGLAMLANTRLRGIRVFRTLFATPIATSVAVASVMALTIFDSQVGWLRYALTELGALAPGETFNALVDPTWALPAVSLPIVWGGLGATFIVVLAALQSIPDDLLEAARLDGAGPWGRFTGVTLPLLAPTLLFLSTIGVIGGLLTFGEIELLTRGGPGERTNVVAYSLYTAAFRDLDQGRAAAIAVLLFLVVALLTGLQVALLRKRIHVAR
jgi:sn-glycerol 3-phosphate transport system permease protein